MPTTTNLGLAVSSNQNDSVLEYWNKMLNETDGNFVILDEQFGILKASIPFTILTTDWTADVQGPFTVSATVTLSNTLIRDNSVVEAYLSDVLNSIGVVLYSVTQSGTDLVLVFYADAAKSVDVSGVLRYVYMEQQSPTPTPTPTPTIDPILANNDWATIKSVCEAGNAANYWAVGDTKTDTGTDNNVRTFRIADMQGLYNKHVVFEQVECEDNHQYMDLGTLDSDSCYNHYEDSYMRSTYLPALILKYSSDLQTSLTNTTYKVQKNGKNSTLLDLTDKLFLPACREVFKTADWSAWMNAEWNSLTLYQYYNTNSNNSSRVKHTLSSSEAVRWWLRSPYGNNTHNYVNIETDGVGGSRQYNDLPEIMYVTPVFSF